MLRKLVVLTTGVLLTIPAYAQSSVSIYGIVDMGYRWSGKHFSLSHYQAGTKAHVTPGNRSGLDSGIQSQSRIGFKGVEDLGNGFKASFVLERGLASDTGADIDGWNRQAFVALSGGFGTFAFGRQQTPQYLLATMFDPFSDGTDGKMTRTYLYNPRLDNLATYTSPNWGGFSFIAGYSQNGAGDESPDNLGKASISNAGDMSDTEFRAVVFAPMFVSDRFSIALNFNYFKMKDSGTGTGYPTRVPRDDQTVKVYDLMASYDFGPLKLAGAIGKRKISSFDFVSALTPEYGLIDQRFTSATLSDPRFFDAKDSIQFMVGVTVPVGSDGKVLASYTRRKTESGGWRNYDVTKSDMKVKQFAIGYMHNLSKRTNLYVAYSHIENNDTAKFGSSYGDVGDNNGYQRAFNVGIRHMF